MTIYGRSEELVSRCIECDLAEPESLASLGGSAPGLVDGILSMVVQMAIEGITTASDLVEFDKDSLDQLANNLRQPGGRVPDPNPNTAPQATIPAPAFTFGVKSQKRLLAATNLVKYFVATGRDLIDRSLLPSGGLMVDVPCLDHSLDGCKGYPDDVQTTKHA